MARPGSGQPQPPQGKKDNTPMIIGGVCVGALVLVGLVFAMKGEDKPKPQKKEPPKAVEKAPEPVKEHDPWDDPANLGSETDMAKKRAAGQKDQNTSGDVDRTKVGK